MATKNVLQTVLAILGTTPDEAIKSDTWIEIFKLQLALKGLASAIDSLRAKAAVISSGQEVTFQSIGNVEYALYLQDLTRVQVVAGATIKAGLGVRFVPNGGSILAYPCHRAYKTEGYCIDGASAGALGTFILKGFVGYSNYSVSKTTNSMNGVGYSGYLNSKETAHHRLQNHYLYSADGYWSWYGAYEKYDGKITDPATYNYTGVVIGNSGATWLTYFNPERA